MKPNLFVCWLAVFVLLQPLAIQAQIRKIDFVEYDLDNGLHVILHKDNTTPIVAVSVMYHVGSKNEKEGRTGFAHFFEHLMFEGSANIGRGKFMKIVQTAGGTLNAYTTQDQTYYYEILPSNQLELGLYLESERMLHAKVDSVGIETQREVVKEEKRQRYDNQPYASFSFEIFRRAYKEHPYQWTPIGTMTDLNAASYADFTEFYQTYYVPDNATLCIAGDIDITQTQKLVEDYFAEIPKGTQTINRPDMTDPGIKQELRDTIYDNIQLPAIFTAYQMPALGTDDYYALSMLTSILSGGASSRLYKKLVDNEQKAIQVAAFPYALEDPGLFIILGITNMGVSIIELEKSIDEEIKKIKEEKISDREYQKIRNQIEADFISSNATMAGIAESLAQYHVFHGDAGLINTEIDKYLAITKEDIMRVAKKYLNHENRVVLHYLPVSAQNEQPSTNEEKGK